MKCGVCGRTLKNPDSKKMGYGPVCYKRAFGSSHKAGRRDQKEALPESAGFCEIPGQISMEDYLREFGNL